MSTTRIHKVWVHENDPMQPKPKPDIIINVKSFPNIEEGDLLDVHQPSSENSCHLIIQAVEVGQHTLGTGGHISLQKSIAGRFRIQNLKDVNVYKITSKQQVALELVEIVFKGQYVGRNDMYRLSASLKGQCMYVGKTLDYGGIRGQISELWLKKNSKLVASGYVDETTKIVYRSSSCQIQMLIQMSTEMADYDWRGDQYIERTFRFLEDLFRRWKEQRTTHTLSVVLFARVVYDELASSELGDDATILNVLPDGTVCQDFYQVLLQNEASTDFLHQLKTIRAQLNQFFGRLEAYQFQGSVGRLAQASEGNILEALNLAVNVFDHHHIDRVFERTGLGLLILTAGAGIFQTTQKLLALSQQRIRDNGIGCDLVCFGERPNHLTPAFTYQLDATGLPFRNPSEPVPSSQLSYSSMLPTPTTFGGSELRLATADAFSDGTLSRASTVEPVDDESHKPIERGDAELQYARPEWIHQLFYHENQLVDGMQQTWPDQRCLPARYLQINEQSQEEAFALPRVPMGSESTDARSQEQHDHNVWLKDKDRTHYTVMESSLSVEAQQSGISIPASYSEHTRRHRLTSVSENPRATPLAPSTSASPLNDPIPVTLLLQGDEGPMIENPVELPTSSLAASAPRSIPFSRARSQGGWNLPSPTGSLIGSFQDESRAISSTPNLYPLRRAKSDQLVVELSARDVATLSGHKPFNPFEMPRNQLDQNRWIHAFPRAYADSATPFGPSWKSLCTPACLPLTILDNVDQINFARDYMTTHTYPIQYFEHWNGRQSRLSQRNTMKHLFVILQSQRLSQGFQLCVSATDEESGHPVANEPDAEETVPDVRPSSSILVDRALASSGVAPGRTAQRPSLHQRRHPNAGRDMTGVFRLDDLLDRKQGVVHGVKDNDDRDHWMSCGVQFHKIALARDGNSVAVEVHQLRSSLEIKIPQYRYQLMPFRRVTPTALSTDLSSYAASTYNWNKADVLISSQVSETLSSTMVQKQNFWRVRYALFPKVQADLETLQAQFVEFIGDLQRILAPHLCEGMQGETYSPMLSPVTELKVDLQADPADLKDEQVLSQFVWLDIDPQRTGERDEWALLYTDRSYHPSRCFHIECQWLVATACTIQAIFERVQKRAEARNLLFNALPIEQLLKVPEPMHRDTLRLPLELKLPLIEVFGTEDISDFQWELLQSSIVGTLDLILDVAADEASGRMDLGPRGLPLRKQRQYIHRSGNALVTIDRKDQTLGFVTNYLSQTKRWFGSEDVDLEAVLSGKRAVPEAVLVTQLVLLMRHPPALKLLIPALQTDASTLKHTFFDWWGREAFSTDTLRRGLSVSEDEMAAVEALHKQAQARVRLSTECN